MGFVPRGVARFDLGREPGPAEDFVFLVLPRASMQPFAAAVEPLRIANQLTGRELYRWHVATPDGGPAAFSNGLRLLPDQPAGQAPPRATVFACGGVEPETATDPRSAAWLRALWRAGHVVGGICTGAYALAAAGLLAGHAFTLHWENAPGFEARHPGLVPLRQLFVVDRRIVTCGGGTAATDLLLHLIARRHGPGLARMVMDMCIHPVERTGEERQQTAYSFRHGMRHPRIAAILEAMETDPADDTPMSELARRHGLSRRQMERLFHRYVGTSPERHRTGLRLERARRLLTETDDTVLDVALACGFATRGSLSRQFRHRFGVPPHRYAAGARTEQS